MNFPGEEYYPGSSFINQLNSDMELNITKIRILKTICAITGFILATTSCSPEKNSVTLFAERESPGIQFAVAEIRTVLRNKGMNLEIKDSENADILITAGKGSAEGVAVELKPEGFSILKSSKKRIKVTGYDDAGAMYGGLELAEQIRLFGLKGIREAVQNPYMEIRGTKFNIPLDVRTPSYTDVCDAAQKNIPEMWNFDFWKDYIDNLARYRYNLISLWSLHPFPSLVKVPEYPDVALDDVQRSAVSWEENYDLNGTGFDAPEILANPEIIKKITIDEKIEFWRHVMKYAADRNIRFYVVTWNIFTNGTGGKYRITDEISNKVTRDYFRKSVKQMFLTYPDLAGIGLTTGENMPGATAAEKEDWAFETYGLGLTDAANEFPDRRLTFIHRQHQTGAREIAKKFAPLTENKNVEFLFSFKYAQAHAFSSTRQTFHLKFIKDIEGMKTLWTLRNDDNYHFRWGAPDFVREFIKNIPYEVSKGFYYGSDQWIWGREFLSKEPETPRQLEIVKHWYHWMLWGRLGYNPDLDNERFIQIIQNKFPEANAGKLFTAWQEASMIYPLTTGFHWGALDFQWYIEACKSRPSFSQTESGFHDVNRFITLPPHPGSGFQSIPDYVKMLQTGDSSDLITPLQVAEKIHHHADIALKIAGRLKSGDNREFRNTLNDIRAMAHLGKYYSCKIRGATNLALYRATGDKKYQEGAVRALTEALGFWKTYIQIASDQYINPLWTNRVGYVDWIKLTAEAGNDIETARTDMK